MSLWVTALLVFGLRVIDMTLDTLRTLIMVRGYKAIAWLMGFAQAMVFLLSLSLVMQGDAALVMLGYAAGFATGNVLGMWIEERLALGHLHLRIISPRRGDQVAQVLRAAGYGVTVMPAQGRDGAVALLNCNLRRRDVRPALNLVRRADPEAFVTAEVVRPLRRGFWRA